MVNKPTLARVKGIAPISSVLETDILLLNYTPTLLLLDGRAVCTHRASAKVGHLYAILVLVIGIEPITPSASREYVYRFKIFLLKHFKNAYCSTFELHQHIWQG